MKNTRIFKNKIFESAVMICILRCEENGKDYIVLEKRADGIRQAGEISFPGGKKDKSDKDFLETAIRETIEELGIKRENIIDPEYYGTFFFLMGVLLETFICYLKVEKISDIVYNKDEVEKLLFVPIDFFINNEPIMEEIRVYNKTLFGPFGFRLAWNTSLWLIAVGMLCILGAWYYTGGKNPYGYRRKSRANKTAKATL